MTVLDLHVPLGLWFGVSAAVAFIFVLVTVGVARLAPEDARGRVLAGLTWWLALAAVLAGIGAFATTYHRPALSLAAGIVLPIVVGVVLLRRPGSALSRVLDAIPLRGLIGVQSFRVLGGVFIIAWALGHMPAIFALPAGIGDIAVGVAAPFVAARIADGTERSRRIAVWWNIEGLADFVLAVSLGAATSPTTLWPTLLGHPNPLISRLPFVLIPVFLVPVFFVMHIATLRRLTEREPQRAPLDASSLPGPARVPAAR